MIGTRAAVIVVVLLDVTVAFAQSSPKAALLEQSAWSALDAGQLEAAGTAFTQALAIDPSIARAHLGLAFVAFAERRDAEARAAADRALALNPALWRAREVRARVFHRGGDLASAVALLEALVAEGHGELAETLSRWRREREVRSGMNLAVGSTFTIAFEGADDSEVAREAVAALERAAARISDVLSAQPSSSIAVVLYTNEQFRDITRSPAWAAAAYDGTIRVPIGGALADRAELERVLAHEYVHALVHDLAKRRVPAWLNEGLAAALERESPPRETPRAPIALGTLERSFQTLPEAEARRAYETSAFVVSRLLDESGGFAIVTLLRDLGAGVRFADAFAHRMSKPFDTFLAGLTPQ